MPMMMPKGNVSAGNASQIRTVSVISRADRISYSLLTWPAFALLFCLTILPLFFLIFFSLTDISMFKLTNFEFIGFHNFISAMGDENFWKSIYISAIQVAGMVTLEMLLGMLSALLLLRDGKFIKGLRLAFLVPLMIAPVVVAYTWRLLYNTDLGVFNYFLSLVGIGRVNWLGHPTLANISIILSDVWLAVPMVSIILLAGLQSISMDYYEASQMDGAGPIRQFFLITMPLIKPTFLVAFLFRLMDAIRSFDIIYALTGGGPGNWSKPLNVYVYERTFQSYRIGYGSSLAVMMLLLIFLLSSILLNRINHSEAY